VFGERELLIVNANFNITLWLPVKSSAQNLRFWCWD
jgi:hypothetical protein